MRSARREDRCTGSSETALRELENLLVSIKKVGCTCSHGESVILTRIDVLPRCRRMAHLFVECRGLSGNDAVHRSCNRGCHPGEHRTQAELLQVRERESLSQLSHTEQAGLREPRVGGQPFVPSVEI